METNNLYHQLLEMGESSITLILPIDSIGEGERVVELAKELEVDGKLELRDHGLQSDSVFIRVNLI
ncbi:hypothetical protein [Peribacillus kribbensis]|uniref:hypothetical protein n=1 Tax=Peribacillus kribbensis TaxID=356658 RepID=UPI00041453B3|nr:hypothetical protein [Peribacillus kribbensis]